MPEITEVTMMVAQIFLLIGLTIEMVAHAIRLKKVPPTTEATKPHKSKKQKKVKKGKKKLSSSYEMRGSNLNEWFATHSEMKLVHVTSFGKKILLQFSSSQKSAVICYSLATGAVLHVVNKQQLSSFPFTPYEITVNGKKTITNRNNTLFYFKNSDQVLALLDTAQNCNMAEWMLYEDMNTEEALLSLNRVPDYVNHLDKYLLWLPVSVKASMKPHNPQDTTSLWNMSVATYLDSQKWNNGIGKYTLSEICSWLTQWRIYPHLSLRNYFSDTLRDFNPVTASFAGETLPDEHFEQIPDIIFFIMALVRCWVNGNIKLCQKHYNPTKHNHQQLKNYVLHFLQAYKKPKSHLYALKSLNDNTKRTSIYLTYKIGSLSECPINEKWTMPISFDPLLLTKLLVGPLAWHSFSDFMQLLKMAVAHTTNTETTNIETTNTHKTNADEEDLKTIEKPKKKTKLKNKQTQSKSKQTTKSQVSTQGNTMRFGTIVFKREKVQTPLRKGLINNHHNNSPLIKTADASFVFTIENMELLLVQQPRCTRKANPLTKWKANLLREVIEETKQIKARFHVLHQ